MLIRNNSTGKSHGTTKKGWDSLGKNQNLFTIVDPDDTEPQRITNVAKPAEIKKPVEIESKKNQQQQKHSRPSSGEESKKQDHKTRK